MLSAQKEEIRLAAGTSPDDLPNLGSFGKVVNSIQGLQQRLENFSADDVGNAHDKTQTLLLRLSDLRGKLETFTEIKASMAAVRDAVEQPLSDCAEIAKLDAVEKHAPIQTFMQANKLIQFPRLNKSAKIPGTQIAGDADQSIWTCAQVQENDAPIPRVAEDSEKGDAAQSLEAINLPALTSQSAIQTEITTATVVEQENGLEDQLASRVADLSSATAFDPLLTPDSEILPVDEPQIDICDSAASGSCDANTEASPRFTSPAATANEEETKDTVATTASTDFDQRLLDDLIKNYGEFAASRKSSPTIEIPDSPPVNTTKIYADPTVRSTEIEFERKNLPSTKTNGDLDRQLKKLIKDYGEYDLYPRQSPINLKTGVIAAFLLLALIFSGFYYFSPRAMNSQTSTPAQSRPSTSAGSSDHDSLANRPGATVTEKGALHETENNSRLKNRP
jgi:hypothetical protein